MEPISKLAADVGVLLALNIRYLDSDPPQDALGDNFDLILRAIREIKPEDNRFVVPLLKMLEQSTIQFSKALRAIVYTTKIPEIKKVLLPKLAQLECTVQECAGLIELLTAEDDRQDQELFLQRLATIPAPSKEILETYLRSNNADVRSVLLERLEREEHDTETWWEYSLSAAIGKTDEGLSSLVTRKIVQASLSTGDLDRLVYYYFELPEEGPQRVEIERLVRTTYHSFDQWLPLAHQAKSYPENAFTKFAVDQCYELANVLSECMRIYALVPEARQAELRVRISELKCDEVQYLFSAQKEYRDFPFVQRWIEAQIDRIVEDPILFNSLSRKYLSDLFYGALRHRDRAFLRLRELDSATDVPPPPV